MINSKIVYSTNKLINQDATDDELTEIKDLKIRIFLDRKAGGKKVSVIRGFKKTNSVNLIGKELKKRFGVGGSVKNDTILIQGDRREKIRVILADKGYDEIYGARELGRVIQEEVKKPMAEELIFGSLVKGGHVEIYIKDKKIAFNYLNKKEVKKELV